MRCAHVCRAHRAEFERVLQEKDTQLAALRSALESAQAAQSKLEEDGRILKRAVAIQDAKSKEKDSMLAQMAGSLEQAHQAVRKLQQENFALRAHVSQMGRAQHSDTLPHVF